MPDITTIRVILPRPQVIRIDTTAEGGGGASEFIELTDVPQSYSGAAAQIVRVNAGETGLEFSAASGGGNVSNTGTPTVGQMSQWTNATTIKGVTVSGSGATISINTSGVIAISAIANASLVNSVITIAGTSTALGGTISRDTITGVSSNGLIKRSAANTLVIAVAQTDYWDTTDFAGPTTHGLVPDPGPAVPATVRVLTDDGSWQTIVAGGGAPLDAHYVTTQSDGTLTDEFNLGSLTTGLLKHTVMGAISTPATAVAGTDYTDNAFKTIVVSGQSNVVADGAADTLTLVAGTNITITTNASTDTITITAAGGGNVSSSGTPTVGQMAQWTDATTVKGVTISGSGATITVNTSGVVTISAIADASLTNPQTYAAIVPNTAPSAGQILIGNAGNTAYAKNTISGSGATITLGATGVITISGIANASLTNSAITIAGTSTALGGTITLDTITGVSSNGFLTRTGANTLTNTTAPSGAVVGTTDTQTLTNKRVTPRITAITSNATWAPNADTTDVYEVTAQAAAATTISNPSGTPTDGQKLIIRATCDGTNRALTWSGSEWRASADLALPTTLTASKTMYLGFMYTSVGPKWDLLAKLDNFA